jgi:ribosomal protein S18 acetylase RimI-like enzyme
VDPAYKRHGVATRLLHQLTTLFIKRETRIILVDTDETNHRALAFFRKNGFGHEIKHVYLSCNIDDHPLAIERKEALRGDEEED